MLGVMLHDASGPTWRQTTFVPAASGLELEGSDLAIAVFGRFASHGGFDYRNDPPGPCLHIVTGGQGFVRMGGFERPANAGTVFCMMKGHRVAYWDKREKPWRYTWMNLVGRRAVELAGKLGGTGEPWLRDDLPVKHALGLFDEIEAAFRSEDHSPFYAQTAAWRVLDALSPRKAGDDRAGHLATAVRRVIDAHFATPLKLGALADQLGVDRSTVFRRFQALYGSPPKAYLDRVRLDHALALLRDGGLSIAAIAARCGYASAHRFAKAFRARYGVAPSKWRG